MKQIPVLNDSKRDIVLPTPRVRHGGPGQTRSGVRLPPGTTLVDEAYLQEIWDQAEGKPADKVGANHKKVGEKILKMFEDGPLRIADDKEKHKANKMNAKQAIAYVEKCTDENELQHIFMHETRQTVLDAIDAQVHEVSRR